MMTIWMAVVLGIVEGLTEYLPVSSTGHLLLMNAVLGKKGAAIESFDIVIQLGAILAVLVQYRGLLWERTTGLVARKPEAIRLFTSLAVAFVPTAVVGLLLRKAIKAHLFGVMPVAGALIVGGILMILVERIRDYRQVVGEVGLERVTWRRALVIGIGQCFSMWPGASRSMCTIVAGQFAGLSTATAAEFSFLLGLPTLGAATVYEGIKARQTFAEAGAVGPLIVGLVVSFLVAWAVIAVFIQYLKRRGLEPFGYYRIVLGLATLWLVQRG